MYTKFEEWGWGIDGVDWSAIDKEVGLELERPFSKDEIKAAIFDSGGSRAPGPDGFSMADRSLKGT